MIRHHAATLSLCGAIAIVVLTASPTIAAVQEIVLNVARGSPGTSVSLHVEMSSREGTEPGTLYLVPQAAFDLGPYNRNCDQIPGTVALGDMAFHREIVEISGWTGDGYVGEATFTVPPVAVGAYYLSVAITARGDGCHVFGGFTVTATGLPDTALPGPKL
jgi:hypothetical protein